MSLYLVATPIGNLKDITSRALEVLRSVKVMILENYRDSVKLLNYFQIKPEKILVFNEKNRNRALPEILQIVKEQDAAYIVSAGMPGISDPGQILIDECYKNQIAVLPIPGPSALTTALAMSGFRSNNFLFTGFLPRKEGKIKKILEEAWQNEHILVFFESPYRLEKTLKFLQKEYPASEIFIGKEMTKMFETYLRGNFGYIFEEISKNPKFFKGEFTVVVRLEK